MSQLIVGSAKVRALGQANRVIGLPQTVERQLCAGLRSLSDQSIAQVPTRIRAT